MRDKSGKYKPKPPECRKEQLNVRLSRWLIERLRQQGGISPGPHIEALICEHHGWIPPDECLGDEAGRKPE